MRPYNRKTSLRYFCLGLSLILHSKLKDKSSVLFSVLLRPKNSFVAPCGRVILILRQKNLSKHCLLRFLCLIIKYFTVCAVKCFKQQK